MTVPNNIRKIKIPKACLAANFRAETFNDDTNEVELVWSTGAKVKRYSWSDGEFIEELSLKKDHVNLDRLNKGAPLLNNHSSYDLRSNIGIVRKAWITKGEGRAIVQLSSRDEVAGIVQDVKAGIIKNVSVGYRVEKFEDVTKKGEIPTLRAIDWTPMELSLVNIPADEDSQVRSAVDSKNNHYDCNIFRKEIEMTKEERKAAIEKLVSDLGLDVSIAARMVADEALVTLSDCQSHVIGLVTEARALPAPVAAPVTAPVVDAAPVVDTDAARSEGVELELKRSTEITSLVTSVGLERSVADQMIKDKKTIEEAESEVIATLAKANAEKSTSGVTVEVGVEQRNLRREACVRAIQHRNDPGVKLENGDNAFIGGNLLDTARSVLEMEGQNVRGLFGEELAKRALHHSSDFGSILENVTNKSLRAAYEEAPQTFMPFTRERNDVKDFKDISSTQLGEGSGLEKVNEHGEYKKSTLSESAEKYKVEKYGKILGFTWELLLNDDLDAFSRIPAILGRKVRDKESELIWNIIITNALMYSDNKALFHIDHGNLAATPSALDVANLGKARSQMRLQTGLDGELLNLKPAYLYVPTTLETTADQITANITAQKSSDVNPFSNRLTPVVEPRLDAMPNAPWFLSADKGQIDMVELARLSGRGPEMFTREGFNVDGMETKIRYVFGVKAIDFRGLFKNTGV